MSDRFERALSTVVALAALATAASIARREFLTRPIARREARTTIVPRLVPGWKRALQFGVRAGDSTAPVKIIEFADLECPACRAFYSTWQDVVRQHPNDVVTYFVHFPLTSIHRFARQAAQAVDCADSPTEALSLISLIYAKQDSLGLKPWASFAREAGVRDTARLSHCATSTDTKLRTRIDAGVAFGEQNGVTGTPTFIINGWRFERLSPDQLGRLISLMKERRVDEGSNPNTVASLLGGLLPTEEPGTVSR